MACYENVLQTIGRTPLVRLNRMAESGMARVLVKAEFLNPGGSIKDRMALHMIEKAEASGAIKPGATIIEGTAGNTGLGMAIVAAVKGYRCIFTMPDKMSSEKINMLKAFGAEVVVTPTAVDHDSPESYYQVAKRLAQETPNSFYVNQYFHPDNPEAHYLTTGPEIWEDTDGEIDYFVVSAGTGGTVTGAGRYLKEQAKVAGRDLKVVCPDPYGSIFYDVFHKREPESGVYKVEGIGNDILVGCLDMSLIDEMRKVSDRDSFLTARRLTKEEGLFAGGSSGANVFVAMQIAKEIGPGKTVVTVLPDSGGRYLSKCYNDAWMKDLGYLDFDYKLGYVRDILQFKGDHVEFAEADETIAAVAARMSTLGISQLPVVSRDNPLYGMIHEVDLLQSLLSGRSVPGDPVGKISGSLHGIVGTEDSVSDLETIFSQNNVAVVVANGRISGIITKIDLVRYLASLR